MHEFALAEAVVEQVERLAAAHPGQIAEVELAVGELTAVNHGALEAAFDALKQHSERLRDCALICRAVPLWVRCAACGQEGPPVDPLFLACSHCASGDVEALRGRNLDIVRVRVDERETSELPSDVGE